MTRATIVAILVLAGCSDDGQQRAADHGADVVDVGAPEFMAPDAPVVDLAVSTATITGTLIRATGKQPAADVQICLYRSGQKTSQCSRSDATGAFRVAVPTKEEVALLFEGTDVWRFAIPAMVPDPTTADIGTWQLFTDAEASALFAQAGLSYPPVGKGSLSINANAGAQVSLVPGAGVGPYYVGSDLKIDLTMTEMGSTGFAVVFDLPAGTYDVEISSPGQSCVSGLGWPPTAATLRGPVIAGFATVLKASCKPTK